MIYLDTHVVVWMFAGRTELLPPAVRGLLEESDLLVSPALVLELQYLYEIGRTKEPARVVIEALGREIGLEVCDLPFPRVVEIALEQGWTRDPFDRLIVSQATLRDTSLVTQDGAIREHYPRAIWKE